MKTAYFNGTVYTADNDNSAAEAFIVEDGRFSFVGRNADLKDCDEKVDLCGKCVIPGLVDSHCHFISGVYEASMELIYVDTDTGPEKLGEALLKRIKEKNIPEEKTVAAMGIDLSRGDFSARDIDCAIGDRPVGVYTADGHALLLNSRAMEILGINKDTKDPDSGSYFVRDAGGNPTGLVIEIPAMMTCMSLFDHKDVGDCSEVLIKIAGEYTTLGYTTVFDAMSFNDDSEDVLKSLKSLDEKGQLPIRIVTSFGYHGEDSIPAEEVIRIMKRERELYSSENVFPNTLKVVADGTVEERSALLFEPYADSDGNFGSEIVKKEEMKKAAELAAKEGFSVHIHAIGDRAVKNVLDVLCGMGKTEGTKTIAHNQLYRQEDIERILKAGDIFFQTTPHWMKGDEHTLKGLGEKRSAFQFPVGTMQRNGVCVSFGSDSFLEEETANAFTGMFYACARGDKELCGEECLAPESERIGRMESLLAYTINGAKQLGLDKETGSITPGKSADFLILDRDIIKCPLSELRSAMSEETYFRGKKIKMGK